MTSRRRGLRKDAPNLLDTSSEEEHEVVASTAVLLATPQKGEQQERGLPPSVRTKLFEAIESKGGVEVVSNSNRLLQSLCDEHPEVFGSPSNLKTPRGRRRKVSNFVDKFKRLTPEKRAARRSKAFTEAKNEDQLLSLSSPPPQKNHPSNQETPLPSIKNKEQEPTPAVAKVVPSSNMSRSPYRSKKRSSEDDEGKPRRRHA
jgi:hypothetical protein